MTLQSLIEQGGPVMYPLLACSVISLGFILERALFFILEARRLSLAKLRTLIRECPDECPCEHGHGEHGGSEQGHSEQGHSEQEHSEQDGTPKVLAGKVLSPDTSASFEALVSSHVNSSHRHRAIRLLQIESNRSYERGLQSLGGLETIATVAPLLGILGTVFGIMQAFQGLDLQAAGTPAAVGAGLAEAMLTTAVGLIVAVPTLVFHNIFLALAEKNASQLQELSDALILKM